MKKILLSYFLFVCAVALTFAQNVETVLTVPVSHWSLGVKGGANLFRVAPTPDSRIHLILGGTVEYSINPLAGIGVELLNNPYGGDINATTTLDGNTFDVAPYFSVNLSNLLSPYREGFWKKVNIFSETGAGVAFYGYSLNNASTTNGKSLLAKTGLNAEYNLSKSLALGLEGQYRYYDRSNMGGVSVSRGHCDALTASIGLRLKLGAGFRQHARNVRMAEYKPSPAPVVDNEAMEYCRNAADQLRSLEQSNAELKQKLQSLEDQLKLQSVKKDLVVKDVEAISTPAPSVVMSFETIEFEFDSNNLTQSSFPILEKMAEVLNNASWSNLKIYGNTDSTGPAYYNLILSEKRANTVKDYLVTKGISASKITTVGNGEDTPVAANDTPEGRQKNRRVDFEIIK